MRKKNHQKRNASGGKARKQDAAKIEKPTKKEEISIILKIQNLINDEIITNNLLNSKSADSNGAKSVSSLNCGTDHSEEENDDYDEAQNSILDFGLSKFVSLSSDSENDHDSDCNMVDSEHNNTMSENEFIETDHLKFGCDNVETDIQQSFKISENLTEENPKFNASQIDLKYNTVDENISDILNTPLLSLCKNVGSTETYPQNENSAVTKWSLNEPEVLVCSICRQKFKKSWTLDKHLKVKHSITGTTNQNDNVQVLVMQNNVAPIHVNKSIKQAMSNIIKGRILRLLKIENTFENNNIGSQLFQNELDSYNLVAERLVEKIVNVSELRINRELYKLDPKSINIEECDSLSEFEL